MEGDNSLGYFIHCHEPWFSKRFKISIGFILFLRLMFLQRMSNGKYKSAEHRATMDKEKTRMSWPVFVESSLDHEFGPLPELITGDHN